MSSPHQRYRAIQTRLMPTFGHPTGHKARHVQTLVALICGMVGSTHSQIPHITDHGTNHQAKTSSVIQQMMRWYQNDAITMDTFFLPCVEPLLVVLVAVRPLALIIDGRTMGRGCVTLMASVVYRGRAIPIAWTVVTGRKVYLPEATHLTLVDEMQRMVPDWAEVIFLGEGECDGVALQSAVDAAGWQSVCRTAKNTLLWRAGQKQHASDMPVQRDRPVSWPDVVVTGQQYGPVHAIAFWDANEAHPRSLLTNLSDAA